MLPVVTSFIGLHLTLLPNWEINLDICVLEIQTRIFCPDFVFELGWSALWALSLSHPDRLLAGMETFSLLHKSHFFAFLNTPILMDIFRFICDSRYCIPYFVSYKLSEKVDDIYGAIVWPMPNQQCRGIQVYLQC